MALNDMVDIDVMRAWRRAKNLQRLLRRKKDYEREQVLECKLLYSASKCKASKRAYQLLNLLGFVKTINYERFEYCQQDATTRFTDFLVKTTRKEFGLQPPFLEMLK